MRIATLAAVSFLFVLSAAPAAAQRYDGSAGYGGGFVSFGDFADGGDLTLDPGWLATAHMERSYGVIGLRAAGAFTQRPLELPGGARDIGTWMADATVVLRPIPLSVQSVFSPFVAGGGGVVSYGLGKGGEFSIEGQDAVYPGDDQIQLAGVGRVGADVLLPWEWFGTPIGLRLEASDHVALESPFRSRDGSTFGPIHNYGFTVSLIGLVDLIP